MGLFHRYGYIYKPLSGGSWLSANDKWKLPDSEILKAIACAHPKFFIGCRSSKSTRFAVLDIDQNSRYHKKTSLEKLLQVLSDAGLSQSSLYRSSYSGGWHLYLFFDEPVNSADLRAQLYKLLTLNDFRVAKGQLEIFPHPGSHDSLGLGLRLPMQQGFAWLDKRTLDVDYERHELSATKALELFVDALEAGSNSYASFRNLKAYVDELASRKEKAIDLGTGASPATNVIPIRRSRPSDQPAEFADFVQTVFHQLPPGIIAHNWYKGRLYHLEGLTGPSQRADAIESIGHYLFYGDPSRNLPALGYGYEKERQWAIEQFLHVHNNGQSKDINRGRADALAQVERATNWRPPHKQSDTKPVKYSTKRPISWIRANANKKKDARARITSAFQELKKEERTFTTEELRKLAGCGRDTLYKHEDIWRAEYDRRKGIARNDYQDLAEGFFAICTDEYNGVVGAASSQSKPPSTSLTQNMPPGRLAARRIAYELSMRSKRAQKLALKTSMQSLDDSETYWRNEVARLTENDPSRLSIPELKALLTVLVLYLSRAPDHESQEYIQLHIQRIRSQLSISADPSLAIVRPP